MDESSQASHPVSDRVLTPPNVLSMLRLVCVPIFLWLILTDQDNWALVVLTLSGVSDYLDGKIARHYNLVTRVGQLLDPLADRLYILSTLLGLAWREIIPWWLVAILVSREVFGTALLMVVRHYGYRALPVHFIGKAATFDLLFAFPLILLGQGDSMFASGRPADRLGVRLVGHRPLLGGWSHVCRADQGRRPRRQGRPTGEHQDRPVGPTPR